MSRRCYVPHFEHVDLPNIQSCFFDGRSHRAYLKIPFAGDRGKEKLCVIGQNPSAADEFKADKTIRYLEKLICLKHFQYRQLIVLNLYSQVDTTKTEQTNPLHPKCEELFNRILEEEANFLVVFGKLTNQGQYCFLDRVRQIEPLLRYKRVSKLNLDTQYAPHPGNPKILYNNFNVDFSPYSFADIGISNSS
ncbi:DUF1643 domain-containing protein [Methylobacillus sp. Pita2]|uniref:DUF1643 domain-containing protein n=1 Tax=Methylobacillus sp. Pita2 TaxID=3383245 RepID=UPI0038B4BB9A